MPGPQAIWGDADVSWASWELRPNLGIGWIPPLWKQPGSPVEGDDSWEVQIFHSGCTRIILKKQRIGHVQFRINLVSPETTNVSDFPIFRPLVLIGVLSLRKTSRGIAFFDRSQPDTFVKFKKYSVMLHALQHQVISKQIWV